MKYSDQAKSLIFASIFALAAAPVPALAASDAMLELLKVLKDKGSLTEQEYEMLHAAAVSDGKYGPEEAASSDATRRNDVARDSGQVKLKGDIRVRFEHQSSNASIDRDRGRIRYRLGIVATPSDSLEVGAGLASGGNDPRSTNQSFDDAFSTKGINLDYAYVGYQFNQYFKGVAGKFKPDNYLYTATDLMWDSDINPEGFSLNLVRRGGIGATFANGGVWVLEENRDSNDDPFMVYGQVGHGFQSGRFFGTIAGTYYSFEEINALGDIRTDGSNTDFRFRGAYSVAIEAGLTDLLGRGLEASVIAEWVRNDDTITSQDTGYALGLTASRNAWSLKYIFADLETNAWPDTLPDSDRFGGLTGVDGHEIALKYALMKNVTLGFDYYNAENNVGIDQDLFQLDVSIKF